jgi:type IV pilus assembly protein PilF
MKVLSWLVLLLLLGLTACSSEPQVPRNTDAAAINTRLGLAYLRNNDLNLAKEKIEKALKQDPKSTNAMMAYGMLLQKLEEPEKANEYFKKAISSNPTDPDLRNNYGGFLCQQGKYKEGVDQFLSAMNNPLYKTPQYAADNIGNCYLKSGDMVRAEAYYRKALDIDKYFPQALYHMARLSFLNQKYMNARAYLQRFNAVAGDVPASLWLCYQVELELDNKLDANHCADKLLKRFPDSKEASQLSLIYDRK